MNTATCTGFGKKSCDLKIMLLINQKDYYYGEEY